MDLVRGDASAEKSLLLDYTRTNNFVVWTAAARNRHWVVTGTSVMVLITLCFQPLASALLSVRNTWIPLPGARNGFHTATPLISYNPPADATSNTLSIVGLNQNPDFNDFTREALFMRPLIPSLSFDLVFLTASGYASASVGYNLQRPPFVWNTYTVMPFALPTDLVTNGTGSYPLSGGEAVLSTTTVTVNATAIRSDTNCVSTPVRICGPTHRHH